MNLEFFKELETVLSLLEKLAQQPEWGRCCDRALGTGEMTLGDALHAVGWILDLEANGPETNWELEESDDSKTA